MIFKSCKKILFVLLLFYIFSLFGCSQFLLLFCPLPKEHVPQPFQTNEKIEYLEHIAIDEIKCADSDCKNFYVRLKKWPKYLDYRLTNNRIHFIKKLDNRIDYIQGVIKEVVPPHYLIVEYRDDDKPRLDSHGVLPGYKYIIIFEGKCGPAPPEKID